MRIIKGLNSEEWVIEEILLTWRFAVFLPLASCLPPLSSPLLSALLCLARWLHVLHLSAPKHDDPALPANQPASPTPGCPGPRTPPPPLLLLLFSSSGFATRPHLHDATKSVPFPSFVAARIPDISHLDSPSSPFLLLYLPANPSHQRQPNTPLFWSPLRNRIATWACSQQPPQLPPSPPPPQPPQHQNRHRKKGSPTAAHHV